MGPKPDVVSRLQPHGSTPSEQHLCMQPSSWECDRRDQAEPMPPGLWLALLLEWMT